jgi:glycosyltransferase involved in cell wall biosynthesis
VKIFALHDQDDNASYWRIEIPLRCLRALGCVCEEGNINAPPQDLTADILILERPHTAQMLQVIRECRAAGVRTIVDVDDLIRPGSIQVDNPAYVTWNPKYFEWHRQALVSAGVLSEAEAAAQPVPRNDAMKFFLSCVREADAVTVPTEAIAREYRALNPHVYVLPNCYDDSNPLWNAPRPPRQEGRVYVGFAGGVSHRNNLRMLKDALEELVQRCPEVIVVEAGAHLYLEDMQVPPENFLHLGLVPFPTYPLLLSYLDVVVAPLVDNVFTRAKSPIRCMEAGLVRAPVVASPVGPYLEYVEHGVNGFFAERPREWVRFLELLVRDAELRRRMGEANRRRAEQYAITKNIVRWLDVFDALFRRGSRLQRTGRAAAHA